MNMLNGLVLLLIGTWGAMEAVMQKAAGQITSFSPTVFIAPAFGILFLILSPAFKNRNKAVVHIIVLLTLLAAISMIMPLKSGRTGVAFYRPLIMLVSGLFATIIYVKSFIDARRNPGA
jgi:peptidoglycan/LPS O-acetylase OafA/YrhL